MVIFCFIIHSRADAERIAGGLLQRRLVAGYNLLGVDSAFWWKGEVLKGSETLVLAKGVAGSFDRVAEYIKAESGYEIPELLSVRPEQVLDAYRRWVSAEATGDEVSSGGRTSGY